MKKTFTIVALTILVWGCAKKLTPAASGAGVSSNSGSVVNAPAATSANTETVPVVNTTPLGTTPATPAGSRTTPAEGSAKSPEMMGQSTYNAKCGKCHGLKVTTDYTAERWISIMQVMAPKARLDDTEKENVLLYVKTNAKK